MDLGKLLSAEGIKCSIERLERAIRSSASDQTDLSNDSHLGPQTAMEYKEEGNSHFQKASYMDAALSWSHGLRIEPNNETLLLNRSLGYLKIGWYEAALRDSEAVLARCPIPAYLTKGSCRAGWAEYGLGLYQIALRRFEQSGGSLESKQWIVRCKQRIREQETGDYKWAALFTEWQVKYKKDSLPIPRLDIADYVGPVEVRPMSERGGGRGVVATRDVKSGELLVMAKPFVSVYPAELHTQRHPSSFTCQSFLSRCVMEKILGRPECASLVASLYAGEDFPAPPSTYPPAITNSPLVVPLHIDDSLDISHVTAVIRFNAFQANPLRLAEFTKTPNTHEPAALHLLPSLFNHACFANTVRYSLGDVMVIRANQDIACGTELTVAYAMGGNHLTRGRSLAPLLGPLKCDCKYCILDRADGDEACQKREKILSDHEHVNKALIRRGLSSTSSSLEANWTRCIKDVEGTYAPERGPLRPSTCLLHLGLAQVYMDRAVHQRNTVFYEDTRHALFASLAAVGIIRKRTRTPDGTFLPIAINNLPATGAHEDAVIAMVQLATTYYCEHERSKAEEWVRSVHWLHAASRGGDATFFQARFKEFLNDMSPHILQLFRSVK